VIVTVVGARPNFVKAAPIHLAFRTAGIENEIGHTGQLYDEAMASVFFEDLGLPRPMVDLGVGSGTHAEQTPRVMVGVKRFFMEHRPRAVLVVGDVNSTMAAAIVAAKMENLFSAPGRPGCAPATGPCRRKSIAWSPTRVSHFQHLVPAPASSSTLHTAQIPIAGDFG
jgi:hypothetical protein